MLTLEETRLTLSFFKVFSILNILPIGVDVRRGKIERQSHKIKVFMWKILFGVGVSHWLYMSGRLVQSTILEPEKYLRWDHLMLHLGFISAYAVFYFTGFRLFIKTPEENVIIFNHLFLEREDPVQKMIDQQLQNQIQIESGSGNGNKNQARKLHEEIEMEVIENGTKSEIDVDLRPRPLLTWPLQYSLDELMAKLNAPTTTFCAFLTLPILAVDPSRPQLLYSSLPPEYQNISSFLILFTVEAICMAVIYFTATFAIVTQMMFLGKCQLQFERMSLQLRNLQGNFQNSSHGIGITSRDIRKEIWILRQILKEMRELVVFIELFNRCFPFCIFAWKICSLSISIIGYFFAIRHHENFPILSVLLGYVAISLTLTYTIMYEQAFSLPGKMAQLKNEFLLTAQKTTAKPASSRDNLNANANPNLTENRKLNPTGNLILWAEMQREVKRIQNIGVKVGSFHTMERESTPNFIDFVFRNVVSLLVTFPR